MTVNQRLNFLIETLKLNARSFSELIGVKEGTTRNYLSRGSMPGADYIEKIFLSIENLNPEWLLTGEGEPFKNDRASGQKGIIHTEGEIPENAIPLYDMEVNAGNVTRLIEDNNHVPVVGWLQLEELPNKNGLIGVRAKGKSMASFIDNGDHLILRPIVNRRFVPLGEAYVIITDEQSVTKYIRAGSTKETYTLRSHNYTMFEDFEVLKTDIKHLFLVVKVIKDVTY